MNPKVVHYKVGMKDQTVWTSMMEDAPQHGWAQKHLTHGNKKIPVLYLAPNDKLDQMAAKASAEAPVSPSAVGADVD